MVGVEELLLVLTAPGDGVIVNPPVYPPFFADITHTGRTIVEVPLLRDGGLDVDGIADAFAAGARAYVLSNPHNPTGRVWTRAELSAVAAAAEAHDAWVLSDEIHAPLVLRRDRVHAVPDGVLARRGADVGLEGVQPGRAEARDHRDRARRPAAAGDELARRLPGRGRGRGGVHGGRRVARRDARDDRAPTTRTWRPSCRPGSRTRCRRRATWRGWTAARAGSATIPRRRSSSAGGSRCRAGWTSARRAPASRG